MPFSLRRVTARHGFAIALGLATLAGAATPRVWDPEPVVRSRLAAFDFYQRVWTRPARAAPVSVVDIDEASLSRIGQWPWPRRQIAALVDRLTEAGAAVVALDMILAEPDRSSPSLLRPILKAEGLIGTDASQAWPDYDAELAAAFRRGRVVASFGMHGIANDARPALKTGFAILGDDPSAGLSRYAGAVTSIPALEAAALGNGGISVVSATDQTIRRTPLLAALDGQVYPSLVLEALRVAQGRDSIAVKSSDGHGLSAVRVGRVEIPLERDGQMWLRYAETPPGRTLPAWSVLDQSAADLRARVGGRIVLVGFSAVGLSDLRATPLNPFEPGVNIHAEAISQIIAADWLGRPSWTVATELAAVIVMALAVILALAGFGARAGGLAAAVGIVAAAGGSAYAFQHAGLLLDPVFPAATLLAVYVVVAAAVTLRTEKERGQIRTALGQFLSPGLVAQIAENPEALALGGEARDMTFLFTDLEGFTAMTERLAPDALVRILNQYLDGLCAIVLDHGGAVDKIVGDAVHAMFNAPVAMADHPARAVRCALAMDAFAMAFQARLKQEGYKIGVTRIGVNTGTAIVGNFGGQRRFDYTAHGDAINTAARLEAANKHLGTRICVAKSTADRCPDIAFRPTGALMLRGKSEGVETLEPTRDGVFAASDLASHHAVHARLQNREDTAQAQADLARLAAEHPDDALLRFQAGHIASGAAGLRITVG